MCFFLCCCLFCGGVRNFMGGGGFYCSDEIRGTLADFVNSCAMTVGM